MSRFQFVADHLHAFEVKWLCAVVEVARSSFYAWLAAADGRAARQAADKARNCQYLWIGLFQATSVPVDSVGAESADGVMSVGRSSSLPLWKIAPARTRATRCGALTARQRACAASISL